MTDIKTRETVRASQSLEAADSDLVFYRRREGEAIRAAVAARDPCSAIAHQKFAVAYTALARNVRAPEPDAAVRCHGISAPVVYQSCR